MHGVGGACLQHGLLLVVEHGKASHLGLLALAVLFEVRDLPRLALLERVVV